MKAVKTPVSDFAGINNAAAARSNALQIKHNEIKAVVPDCEKIEEAKVIVWEY